MIVALCGISGILFRNLMAHSGRLLAAGQHEEPSSGPRDHVTLTPEKFAAAGIVVTEVSKRELSPNRIVPGHIEYNATRHVQLKAPFDGLVRSVEVKVGDRVTEGQVLGIVHSPELGEKRADVLLRETDLQQAKKNEHDWWHHVQENVDDLIARLKRPQDVTQLEKDFADKPLGDYRQQILGAYSRMRLSDKLSSNLKSAADSGAVSGRLKLETDSTRDTEAAKFIATCEQATFDVKQKHQKAEGTMKELEARFMVAKQRLGLLINQPQEASSETATKPRPSVPGWSKLPSRQRSRRCYCRRKNECRPDRGCSNWPTHRVCGFMPTFAKRIGQLCRSASTRRCRCRRRRYPEKHWKRPWPSSVARSNWNPERCR